jgi:ribosome-associated protein
MPGPDDDDLSARSQKKRDQRRAGDLSARLANELMAAAPSVIAKLGLDEDLRGAVDRARAVDSQIARRRAERTLAGDLRRHDDLADLARRLANIAEAGAAEPRLFHLAETWRTRLVEGGLAAATDVPGGLADPLPALVEAAQREHATGRPKGAKRALFRHLFAALK